MNTLNDSVCGKVEGDVIRTLLYFDIFQYPLTLNELFKFHPVKCNEKDITSALSHLRNQMIVFKHDNFYSLHPDNDSIERRKKGNQLAKKRLRTAQRFSGLIAQFPFVQAIMLSGSLSKDYMDSASDIDYFIITTPKRLWLTRGLLALFKRVFLFNSKKFFCTNYFIDSESLEIEEKNLYTAIETTTLISVYGKELCEKFIAQNNWTRPLFPNMNNRENKYIKERQSIVKRFFEFLFSGSIGENLDLFFMKVAMNRWRKQFGDLFNQDDFNLAFKSKRNVSKNHPRFFQKHVLIQLKEKIEEFESSNKIRHSA